MASTKTKNGGASEPQAPEGFDQIGGDFDAFWDVDEANKQKMPLQGKLLSFNVDNSGDFGGFRYLVQLSEPATGIRGSGSDSEKLVLEAGSTLAVRETEGLKELRPYVENKCEVWLYPKEKVTTKKGYKFWRFDINARGRAGALPAVVQSSADGEVPFDA